MLVVTVVGSSGSGSSGCSSGSGSGNTILPEAVEKATDLEMIGYASFVHVFEKLR